MLLHPVKISLSSKLVNSLEKNNWFKSTVRFKNDETKQPGTHKIKRDEEYTTHSHYQVSVKAFKSAT